MTRSKRGVELARLGALGGEASDNQDAEEKRVKRVAAGGSPGHSIQYEFQGCLGVELGMETGERERENEDPCCARALACQAWAPGSGLVFSDCSWEEQASP